MYFTFADKKSGLLPFGQWSPCVLAVDCATRELYYTSGASSSLSRKSRDTRISFFADTPSNLPDRETFDLPSNEPKNADSDALTDEIPLNSFSNTPSPGSVLTTSNTKNNYLEKREIFQWKKMELAYVSPVARDEAISGPSTTLHQLYKIHVHSGAVSYASSPPSCSSNALLFPSAGPVRNYTRMHESNSEYLDDPYFQREIYERIQEVVAARRRQEETERVRRLHRDGHSRFHTAFPNTTRGVHNAQMEQSLSHNARDQMEFFTGNRSTTTPVGRISREGMNHSSSFQAEGRGGREPLHGLPGEVGEEGSETRMRNTSSGHLEEYRPLSSAPSSSTSYPLGNAGNDSTTSTGRHVVIHPAPTVESTLIFSFYSEWEYWRFYYVTSLILGVESRQRRPYYGLPPYDPRNGIGLSPFPPPVWCKLKWLRGFHYPYIFVHGNLMGWKRENPDRGSSATFRSSFSAPTHSSSTTKTLEVAISQCYLSVTHDLIMVFNSKGKAAQWVELKYVHTVYYNKSCFAPFIVFLTDEHQPDIIFVPTPPPEGTFLGKERENRLSMMAMQRGRNPSISSSERRGDYGRNERSGVALPNAGTFSSRNVSMQSPSEDVSNVHPHSGVSIHDGDVSSSCPTIQGTQYHAIESSLSRNQSFGSSSLSPACAFLTPLRRADNAESPPLFYALDGGESSTTALRSLSTTGTITEESDENISSKFSYSRWNVGRLAHIIRKSCFGTIEARRVVVVKEVDDSSIDMWVKRRKLEESSSSDSSLHFLVEDISLHDEDLPHHYDPASHIHSMPPSASLSSSVTAVMPVDRGRASGHRISSTAATIPHGGIKQLDLTLAPYREEPFSHFPMVKHSMRDAWSLFHHSLSAIQESRDRAPLESSSEVLRASFTAYPRGGNSTGSVVSTTEGAIAVPLYDTLANSEVAPLTPGQVDFARSLLEREAARGDTIVGVAMESLADLDALEEARRSMAWRGALSGSMPDTNPHRGSLPSMEITPEIRTSLELESQASLPFSHYQQDSLAVSTNPLHHGFQHYLSNSMTRSRIRYFRESRSRDTILEGGETLDTDEEGEENLYGGEESHYYPAPDIQWINPLQ